MGDGTRENPYTREDVFRLIKENGGTAEGLDLSEKWFEEGIDLRVLDLKGIILQLAHLEGAKLWNAHLEGAKLWNAHLEGAFLAGAEFSPDTRLENVDWGNYILGEERAGDFAAAVDTYRRLKMWYTDSGYYDIAAKFYYREKEAARKGAKRRRDRYALQLFRFLFGYGERWWNIVGWIAGFVIFFALVYFAIGTFIPSWGMLCPDTFLDILYYSAASFIALGYGSWVKEATGLIKIVGVLETFLGFFMMTLLLVTFVRKWTR